MTKIKVGDFGLLYWCEQNLGFAQNTMCCLAARMCRRR